jgi:hypothetical protein
MKGKFLLLGLLITFGLFLNSISPSFGQFGKRAKRAALKTRNKQISRFTVRTDFSKSKKYISFGGGIGATNYFGDLAPKSRRGSSAMGLTRTYTTGFYLHRIHPHITIRGGLTWMRLRGDDYTVADITNPTYTDKGRFIRNLSFRNDIFEASAVGMFDLFPTDRGFLRRSFLNPYGVIGLAFFHHNPQAKTPTRKSDNITRQSSDWVDLQPLGTEGQFTGIPGTPAPYSLWQIGIPLGVGMRYRLADKWDLSLEICYRFVFTDYIDDVSSKYPSDEVYKQMIADGNTLGVTMSNRSAEIFAAVDGENRFVKINSWKGQGAPFMGPNANLDERERFPFVQGVDKNGDLLWQDEDKKIPILVEPKESDFVRIDGNENNAAPRGNKRRDYWLNTAFHLAYILEIKQKPPKFR